MANWAAVGETRRRARAAARAAEPGVIRSEGLDSFDIPGLKAKNIKQRTALRAIKLAKVKTAPQRRATERGLSQIKSHVRAARGTAPCDEDIWGAMRDKDTSRNVKNFQWKGVHGAHKVGKYFSGMPAPWSDYAVCPSCGEMEAMEHILTECPDSAQETIWGLAGDLLGNKIVWEKPKIGQIWGSAFADFRDENNTPHLGSNRAYKIVVSESAFLAWKIRCEKRIEHADEPDWAPSEAEVRQRWYGIINMRIAYDRLLTNRRRYKRRAIKLDTVLETWDELIEGVDKLTIDILRQPGVLVGTGTSRITRGVG
ncbi:hypothetical protein AURDEDRAFT_68784 [Auricularia subglabra TFB-10046 SS5]|nr:hypothetical protein AURDEDRAFT_68784 [Auricularia subglabra TFB-10046 SS5]